MRVLSRSVAAAAALAVGTGLAFLIPTTNATASTGTVTGEVEKGHNVVMTNGQDTTTEDTALWGLDFGNEGVLKTYCIDMQRNAKEGSERTEESWDKFPSFDGKAKPEQIKWVLHNTYPAISLKKFEKNIGEDITKKDAIAGTQAVIWTLSTGKWGLDYEQNSDGVINVERYLLAKINDGAKISEVDPKVSIDPSQLKGEAGEKIGPFTLNTNQKKASITLATDNAATLVDEDGNDVSSVKDGDEVYVQTEDGKSGAATISADVSATQKLGRLFVSNKWQRLVAPDTEKKTARATADATWTVPVVTPSPSPSESLTPSPTPSESTPPETTTPPASTTPPAVTTSKGEELPVTGGNTVVPLAIAGGSLLLLGATLIMGARARRNRTAA